MQESAEFFAQASKVILGKEHVLRLVFAGFLARGHILIEDQPGRGKTTLVLLLARLLGLEQKRVQCTSDMLPGDILGSLVYEAGSAQFRFHEGPIFTQILLADELNRASPKTQSACLQAMEEGEVSVEGQTYPLPKPFLLLATQNPMDAVGTFALPESQLDRFLMRLTMGLPSQEAERALLKGPDRRKLLETLVRLFDAKRLLAMQAQVGDVHISDPTLDYVQSLLARTRQGDQIGLSPRAGVGLMRCAQAWALLAGRDFVTPDDVQQIAASVMNHRLFPDVGVSEAEAQSQRMLEDLRVEP